MRMVAAVTDSIHTHTHTHTPEFVTKLYGAHTVEKVLDCHCGKWLDDIGPKQVDCVNRNVS